MFTLYHNPRCSKSRQALALLQDANLQVKIVEYLKTPLTEQELKVLLKKLGLKASDLLRKKEQEYKVLQLEGKPETELIKAMYEVPKLMERPIVCRDNKAVIGRPIEKIAEFIQAIV